jgi:hypothetical protein
MEQGARHVSALKNRAFDMSFEELVREPIRSLSAAAEFCDLPIDKAAIDRASQHINAGVLSRTPEFQSYEEPLHSS